MKINVSQLVISIILFSPLILFSQSTATIYGTVYSNVTKQPIPAAGIASKGTGRQVLSSDEGKFIFPFLGQKDTLVITSLGYIAQEIPAIRIKPNDFEIFLEYAIGQIDEVLVNTGYQSLPKERAPGSFTHIDNELFNRSVSTDLLSRLEGVTNGLSYELPRTVRESPTSPNLRIRGLSTIDGETRPLIVVDNFPYEGDIQNINPNDVEYITVLKDAAAASIWGARAGNGVIVITTKKGGVSRRPTINFTGNFNVSERPNLYYSPTYLPPADAVELERILFKRGLYAKNDWTAFTPAVEIMFALDEERIDEAAAEAYLEALKQYDIRDEARRLLYRQSVNQQYAVNFNGGSDSYQYYVSAGFDNNKASLIGNDYQRLTLSAKNDFQPLPKLSISTSLSYMQGNTTQNGISMVELSPIGMSNPYVYARLVDDSGNALPIVRNNRYTYTEDALNLGLLDWHYRPLDELEINDNTAGTREIRLNTSVQYSLRPDLSVVVRYQFQNIGDSKKNHYAEESYYSRHMVNSYTQEGGYKPIPLGGILDRTSGTFSSHYGRMQLDYNGRFDDHHELDGLGGFEIRQDHDVGSGSFRLYGYDDRVLSYATNLDFNSGYPVRPRSSGRIPYGTSPGRQAVDRFVSYYANLAYTYDRRYVLSASARWDASNIFGVAFNQKGVPLWSVGAAWNIHDQKILKWDWVDLARLRLTYGSGGNTVPTLSSLPFIQFGNTNVPSQVPSADIRSVGNPDLSWERTNIVNMGLDFGIFNRRVSGSVECWSKRSTNLVGNDFIDPTTGIIGIGTAGFNLDNRRNYADMVSKGFDVELNTLNMDRVFKWQTTLLFNYVTNRVTNYYARPSIAITDYFGQYVVPVIEGNSKDQMYALPWYGLDGTGSPLVLVNGELGTDYNTYFNSLTPDDLIRVGVSLPPYFGSIRNTFTWRSFSVSANLLWKVGHRFRRETIVYNWLFGAGRATHIDYLKRWQQPGDELATNVPSMPESADLRRDQAYLFSTALIERGDHVRLHDVNISYRLSPKIASNIGISSLRLYAYARNLGVIWKQTDHDVDPDVRAVYPQPLQVALGLQIEI